MQIKEMTVSVKHTINLGNYENMVVEASVTATLNESESPEVVAIALRQEAAASVVSQVRVALETAVTVAPTPLSDYVALSTEQEKRLRAVNPLYQWLQRYGQDAIPVLAEGIKAAEESELPF